jgi:hypothetical protein
MKEYRLGNLTIGYEPFGGNHRIYVKCEDLQEAIFFPDQGDEERAKVRASMLASIIERVPVKELAAMGIGDALGAALEGAQDVVKEHRDQVATLALENGNLRSKIRALKEALGKRVLVWNDPVRDYLLCDLCSSPETRGHDPKCILA